MATEEDIYRYILKFEGEETVKKLKDEAEKAEAEFKRLYATLGGSAQATKAAAAAHADLQSQLKKSESATKGMGQALNQAGYAVDDIQSGFRGISNNIQPILSSIPALSAMAGPLSILAIGAYQLYEHWDQLMGLFGLGIPQPALTGPELLAKNLKKATEEMDALLSKTTLEWYELKRLKEVQEEVKDLTAKTAAEANVKSATSQLSEDDKEVGGGFSKAIAESGGKQAFDEFKGTLEDSKDDKGLVYNEAKARMTSVDDAARDMFDAALKGDRISRDAIQKALANGSRFKENIGKFSPETKKQEAAQQEANKLDEEASRNAEAWQKKKEADAQKAIDEEARLNEEASRNAEAWQKKKVEKAVAGTGVDARVDNALLRSALASGGQTGVATKEVTEMIAKELRDKGIGADQAQKSAQEIVEKRAAKLGDEVNEKALQSPELRKVAHIGSADFARSVESAGADKVASNTEAMKDKLTELVRLVAKGPVLAK